MVHKALAMECTSEIEKDPGCHEVPFLNYLNCHSFYHGPLVILGCVQFCWSCFPDHISARICNADITLRCDASVDELIDVVEGNRNYIPCIYLLNKIDQISIEELDIITKVRSS